MKVITALRKKLPEANAKNSFTPYVFAPDLVFAVLANSGANATRPQLKFQDRDGDRQTGHMQ